MTESNKLSTPLPDSNFDNVTGASGLHAESALPNVSAHTGRALAKAVEASAQKQSGSAIKTTNTLTSIFDIPQK